MKVLAITLICTFAIINFAFADNTGNGNANEKPVWISDNTMSEIMNHTHPLKNQRFNYGYGGIVEYVHNNSWSWQIADYEYLRKTDQHQVLSKVVYKFGPGAKK